MSRLLLVPLLLLLLPACAPKAPLAPPEFNDPNRTPTGDSKLEARIVDAVRLSLVTDAELVELEKRARMEFASDADISDYVGVLVGRNENGRVLQFLHDRAWKSIDNQSRAADALGFAMGQLRWTTCERMARDYLQRRHTSGAFLVRGLCMERSGDHEAAVQNILAAAEVTPLDDEFVALAIRQTELRSSSGLMPPGDKDIYKTMMRYANQLEALDKLFVHHLMGRWPDTQLGTLHPGGLTGDDIRMVVESRARGYRHCFDEANYDLKRGKQMQGRLVIEFEVGPLGELRAPHPVLQDWRGHERGPQVAACIEAQMLRLRFPRPRFGLPQVAQHEFAFRPQ